MKPKIIKTAIDYDRALARVEKLMDLDPDKKSAEFDELELLVLLVEQYEDQEFPMDLPDPITAIKFRMDQGGMTRKDMIPYLGSASKVSEILNGKRSLSLTMIRRLSELGIPAEVLLQQRGAELPDDEFMKEAKHFPVPEMVKRGWFKNFTGTSREARAQLEDLMRNFLLPVDGQLEQFALNRKTVRETKTSDVYAIKAWQIRVATLGLEQKSPCYIRDSVNQEFLEELSVFSTFKNGPLLAREFLRKAGIPLVIERHLKKTYLDGAAILLPDSRPMVALTLRNDRLDNFWFTLFHELAHIALHLVPGEKEAFFDDTTSGNTKGLEKEADQYAANALIPDAEWRASGLDKNSSDAEIKAFARSQRVHPAIPAGRIRYASGAYDRFTSLIGSGICRPLFESS